jgi:hypothetical protein
MFLCYPAVAMLSIKPSSGWSEGNNPSQPRYVYSLPPDQRMGCWTKAILACAFVAGVIFLFRHLGHSIPYASNLSAQEVSDGDAPKSSILRHGRTVQRQRDEFPDPPPPVNPAGMTSADWEARTTFLNERKSLIDDIRQQEQIARMLSPYRGYADRALAYCEFAVSGPPWNESMDGLQAAYSKTLRDRPETSEGESERQTNLSILSERIANHLRRAHECEGMSTMGMKVPSDTDLRTKISTDKARISELDRQLVMNGQ